MANSSFNASTYVRELHYKQERGHPKNNSGRSLSRSSKNQKQLKLFLIYFVAQVGLIIKDLLVVLNTLAVTTQTNLGKKSNVWQKSHDFHLLSISGCIQVANSCHIDQLLPHILWLSNYVNNNFHYTTLSYTHNESPNYRIQRDNQQT